MGKTLEQAPDDPRISDRELIVYALRYLADDCEDHRPKTARRMRGLAAALDADADFHLVGGKDEE